MRISLLIAILLAASAAGAYENTPTHQSMSEWGLTLAAVAGYEEIRAYGDPIVRGTVDEDDNPRFANHFWAPDAPPEHNGLPMNWYTRAYMEYRPPTLVQTRYTDGLTWATDGMPDDRDWYGAIARYGYDHSSRGEAYLSLGHVVHMVQDMGQPDHAKNRPHPGGHTHEMLGKAWEAWAEVVAPSDRVAYETLWVFNRDQWPRGKIARKTVTLETAFREVATASQQAERDEGLLHRDSGEIALGLSALQVDNPNRAVLRGVQAGRRLLVLPKLSELKNSVEFAKWHDQQWQFFESNIPLQPLIPWPANIDTEPYLKLGAKLIPLAEEYGAGLMQLYHDIVNHPPIVQNVIILQDGKEMYHKEWQDGPQGRTLNAVADMPLKQGAEAEIRVTFGPSRGRPELQEPVANIRVTLETGRLQWLTIPGNVVSGSNEAVTWSGKVVVQKAGTLLITANDTHLHYDGREHKGDVLDSNPATYALAKPPAPFNWVGYEPGEDSHHALNLGSGCGVCAAAAANEKTFVSGTLMGRVTKHREEESRGLYIDVKADVSYRCLRVGYAWNRTDQQNAIILGAPTGSYEYHWRPFTDDPMRNFSGTNLQGGGAVSMPDRCDGRGHQLDLGLDTPDNVQTGWCTWGVTLEKTQELSLSGDKTDSNGERTTWSLTFEPQPAPEHIQMTDIMNPGSLGGAFGNYVKVDWEAFSPVMTALHVAGRAGESKELEGILNAVSNEFGEALGANRSNEEIMDAFNAAEEAWIYTDWKDDPDAKYRAALEKLRPALAQFKQFKRTWEERYASASLRVAERIEGVNKDAAKKMREQAERLKSKGVESFGDSD